jgi:hypothetical protein
LNTKFIRFALGGYLKGTIGSVRKFLWANDFSSSIECIVQSGSKHKVDVLFKRLSFYAPELSLENIAIRQKPTFRAIRRGAVLLLDQGLMSKIYLRLFGNIFNVDYERNSVDGWQLCALADYLRNPPKKNIRKLARSQFVDHVEALKVKGLKKAYVFGTGTSLERAINFSFDDGFRVVCNTIVRDPELWHHIKPHFIVAGDAIYHFGHTDFAQAFRRDLRARLSESNGAVLFVYPELFDSIVRREFADYLDVLIPVPTGAHDYVDVDLTKRFELPALGNVLNLLLLPIGCTLSRTVALWGFDGRAPDDKLFWSNSQKHSYPELMESLTRAHPAFYETLVPKNKEDSYVKAVHGDELEARLQRAEAKGFKFVMMHPSWTQTLQKRFQGEG